MKEPVGTTELNVAINAKGEDKDPYFRANTLDQLLDWYDVDFVRCAYVTLLGRQPDPEGEEHYVRTLRAGRSRLAILWELRRSQEGREHDPGIAGLDRALRRAARQRKGGVGWLFRLFSKSREGDSAGDWQFRALLNATVINRIELKQLANRMPLSSVSATPVPEDDSGCFNTVGYRPFQPPTIIAPELKRLMARSPLQQYFITSVR